MSTVFRKLASFGRKLQEHHEKFLEEKKRRIKRGDISLAQNWGDITKAFDAILERYAKGEITLERAEELIDRNVNYVRRYEPLFMSRGLGYQPSKRASVLGEEYKVELRKIKPKKKKKHKKKRR